MKNQSGRKRLPDLLFSALTGLGFFGEDVEEFDEKLDPTSRWRCVGLDYTHGVGAKFTVQEGRHSGHRAHINGAIGTAVSIDTGYVVCAKLQPNREGARQIYDLLGDACLRKVEYISEAHRVAALDKLMHGKPHERLEE